MKRITAFVAAALLLVGLPSLALAGGYLVVTNDGVPYAWDNTSPIPWNPDQGGLGTFAANAAAVAYTQAALDPWALAPETNLSFVNAGNLPIDVIDATDFFLFWQQIDGLSPVVFDETGFLFDQLFGPGTGVLGFATVEVITTTAPYFITESFQAYNGRWIDGIAANGEFPLANFGAVITHEFGHALNFDHNQLNGHYFIGDTDDPGFAQYGAPPVGSVELMFPFLFGNALDALAPLKDDASWAGALYPGAGASGVNISGAVFNPDGVSMFQGANLIARNPANPFFDCVSNVSGYLYNPGFQFPVGGSPPAGSLGGYLLPNLTAATDYTVEMVRVNPNFTGGSSVGPLSPPAPLAIEEFYNGANETNVDPPDAPADFTLVASGSGGIDMVINGLIDPNEPNNDPSTCTATAYGNSSVGIIDPAGDQDWFCFTGNGGDLIEAYLEAFTVGTGLDPTLTLVDTDGVTVLAFNDDFNSLDSRVSTCLPADGEYYLVVQGFFGISTGEYTLFLELLGTADPEPNNDATTAIPLADSCPADAFGCLAPSGDTDFYALSVTAGTSLQINMDTEDPFGSPDAFIRLYDTDGITVLDSDDDGGPGFDSQINWTFAATGTYYVECLSSPVFDPFGVGTYNLTVGGPAFVTHSNALDVDTDAGGSGGWNDYSPAPLGTSDHFFDGHYGFLADGVIDDGDDADLTGNCIALYAPSGIKDEKSASLLDENEPVLMTGASPIEVGQFTYRNEFRCNGDAANWTVVETRVTNTSGVPQNVRWYAHVDMDVGTSFSDDGAAFDGSRNLAYQFDAGGPYTGIALLSGSLVDWQINNFAASDAPDNTGGNGEGSRFDFMTGNLGGDLSNAGTGDKNVSLAADFGTIMPGATATIYWCVAGGTDLADLQADVDDALNCVPTTVALDIKPTSCPNPFNVKKKGVTPVAILGSADLDVTTLDPSSITLEGVSPKRWSIEDVSQSGGDELCACSEAGPDGYPDLTLKFDHQSLVAAIGDVSGDDVIVLTINGTDVCGRPFSGTDCMRVNDNVANLDTGNGEATDDFGRTIQITQTSEADEPVQRITYLVPEQRQVRLNVFSVTGRLVDTLVQGVEPAGSHEVAWDASGQPSGIYFLRLVAGSEVVTRKIMIRH